MKIALIILCAVFVFSFLYDLLKKLDDFLSKDQNASVPKEKRKK